VRAGREVGERGAAPRGWGAAHARDRWDHEPSNRYDNWTMRRARMEIMAGEAMKGEDDELRRGG
jgi:hypothetical protein